MISIKPTSNRITELSINFTFPHTRTGRNLLAADKGGDSDPYVTFMVDGASEKKRIKSRVIDNNNVDPEWNQVHVSCAYVCGGGCRLRPDDKSCDNEPFTSFPSCRTSGYRRAAKWDSCGWRFSIIINSANTSSLV